VIWRAFDEGLGRGLYCLPQLCFPQCMMIGMPPHRRIVLPHDGYIPKAIDSQSLCVLVCQYQGANKTANVVVVSCTSHKGLKAVERMRIAPVH
jgi:hypothetical protein